MKSIMPLLQRELKHGRVWTTYDGYKEFHLEQMIKIIQKVVPTAYVYGIDYYGRDRKDCKPENRVPYCRVAIRFENDADEAEFIIRESI